VRPNPRRGVTRTVSGPGSVRIGTFPAAVHARAGCRIRRVRTLSSAHNHRRLSATEPPRWFVHKLVGPMSDLSIFLSTWPLVVWLLRPTQARRNTHPAMQSNRHVDLIYRPDLCSRARFRVESPCFEARIENSDALLGRTQGRVRRFSS